MMFTDSYGEQSCTAGRSSFITGQSVLRTGLSKVGIPAAPIGMTEKIVTIAALLKNQGYATGQFGKNHLGDLNTCCRPITASTSSSATSITSTPRKSRRCTTIPRGLPKFRNDFGPRGVIHSWATDKDDPTEEPRWGQVGKQKIEDTGPLTKKRMETCDDEFVAAAKDFIKRQNEGRQAVLRLAQLHPHAPVHAHQEGKPRPGRALAVALPRHDDRSRQERRRDARLPRRARHRRRHLRDVLDRQRPAPQHLARRRHDAVPQREEHQLGRRVPHSDDRALAGQDQGRHRSPTRSSSTTTGCRPSSRWPASRTSSRSCKKGYQAIGRTYKNHIDGFNLLPYLTGKEKESPRKLFVYISDDGDILGDALRQLEGRVHGAALPRHDAGLGGAVRPAAAAQALQPAHRSVRVRRHHVEHLLRLVPLPRLHHLCGA